MPLRLIPGRKGATDVEWSAGHRNGPCSSGRLVQHTEAVDSHLSTASDPNLKLVWERSPYMRNEP